jgi:hypothetical protein
VTEAKKPGKFLSLLANVGLGEVKPAIQLKKLKDDLAILQRMAAHASDDESARIYARRIDDVAKKIVDLEQGR